MTSIDSSTRAQPHRPANRPDHRDARTNPTDVRAMREALDAAKGRLEKPGPQAGQPGRKQAPAMPGQRGREFAAHQPAQDQVASKQSSQREAAEGVAAWSSQSAAPIPVGVPANFAPPHVDPSAFAQMLADLWTRENGRGSKEVHVRFGDRAWPATGARLVRNAGGSLDVALLVGDGGRAYGDHLPGLEDALIGAGVDIGSVAIEADA